MKFKLTNWDIQIALALSAASALIYEVVATDVLFFYFIESSYSIATVLAVFLAGLGIGSFLIYRVLYRIKNQKALFGILQIAIAVYAFFVLTSLTKIIPRISDLGVFVASFGILLVPTIFLGAIFPLAGSIFIKRKRDVIGLVYSSDLFGAVFGALLAGFLLIPVYGNKITVLVGVVFNLISAFLIFPKLKKIIPLLLAIFFLVFSMNFFNYSPVSNQNSAITKPPINNKYKFSANSPYGLITVRDTKSYENSLFINERMQCSSSYKEDSYTRMMADYALNPLESNNLTVLNIGLGCGLTLSKTLNKVTTTVDIVEINPVVVEANKTFSDVLENKRVNLIIDEGLNYLRKTDKKYDSILVDLENPVVVHSSYLYTVEAFETINNSLNENGTFALFNFDGPDYFLDIIYYSIKETFPFVYSYPDVFLASNQDLGLDKQKYVTSTPYKINTLDKNTLSEAYLKWMEEIEEG